MWQYERSNETNCYGMQFFSERTFAIVHICDRVEIWTLMSKVVDKIEEEVAVENIDEKNLLDFKLAGEDELQCDFLWRWVMVWSEFSKAEWWCDPNFSRLS